MNVGIYFGNQSPELGGGHTFEHEILRSLLKVAPESTHAFVLYSEDKEPAPEMASAKNIKFISLVPDRDDNVSRNSFSKIKKVRSSVDRTSFAVLKKILHPKSKFRIEANYTKSCFDSRRLDGIDIMWYVTPTYHLTMDIPYITTVWDLQYRQQPYFPEVSISGQWENREKIYTSLLRRAAFVIVGTETGKLEVEKLYQVPSERVRVLPLPTPDFVLHASDTDRDIRNKHGIPDNYLFYPAQFWPHKNHVNLLLAVRYLRDRHNLIFPVVFAGSDRGNQTYIRQVVSKFDLSKQVYFLGFLPQEDLIPLYRSAFALTFVTFFGPDNLPPLEAFASGCPVIASEVPGAREQLGDAALFVDPKDKTQIADAIKSLHDNVSLRTTLKERGFQRASKWVGSDYMRRIFSILDEFEPIRRCWSNTSSYADIPQISSLNVAGEAAKE